MSSAAPSSFDDWLRRARPRLLRLATSRLRDLGEAEDVVQETVLAVWRRYEAGLVDNLDAYANRAVWQNSIRRKSRLRDWEELEDAELEGVLQVAPVAEAWLEAQELEEAIAGLPAGQAAVVRLRFYAGLSFKEMGEALSIGLNTAASRTRLALGALRRGLTQEDPGEDAPEFIQEDDRGKETGTGIRGKRRKGSGTGRKK